MQTTIFKFLLLLGISFLAVTGIGTNAQSTRSPPQFNLHVVRNPTINGHRGVGFYDVLIDSHVEVDYATGDAIINKTAGFPGFISYFTPTPLGSLYRLDTDKQGILTPTSSYQFQLRYLPRMSYPPSVLLENYTTSMWECHGKCSRYELVFRDNINEPYGGRGTWYISPREPYGSWESVMVEGTYNTLWRGVWDVKWIRGTAEEAPENGWIFGRGEVAGLALVQADWTYKL